MSLHSYGMSGSQEIAVLNLRGRFEKSRSPMYRSVMSAMISVASTRSASAIPATGLPRITRGQSPHASCVDSPTDSRAAQIAGTSSTRIQCS